MDQGPKPPVQLIGLVRVREHCAFTWRQPESGGERTVEVLPSHCEACVVEIERRGYRLKYVRHPLP